MTPPAAGPSRISSVEPATRRGDETPAATVQQGLWFGLLLVAVLGFLAGRGVLGATGGPVLGLATLYIGWLSGRQVVRRIEAVRAVAAASTAADARAALERAERLATTGRLAASIAHEVGNPLSAIVMYTEQLRARVDADAHPVLDAVDRETTRIDRIVRGLLDFARPRRATPRPVRVDAVLDAVVRLVTEQGLLRRVRVQWDLAVHDAEVLAEQHDLEQAVLNLVLNAVEAMDGAGALVLRTRVVTVAQLLAAASRRETDGPGPPIVRPPDARMQAWLARTPTPPAVLQVVVADSGPGVPDAEAERVFEPFHTTKGSARGTGLGLAIAARTIEALGGTIWVQRAREGGAAFVVLLPLSRTITMAPAME